MAIQVVQQPNDVDLAYGPNYVTLNVIGTAEKFAIRILDNTVSPAVELALVSQSPNAVGRAQFDLQQIFQQYVGVSKTTLETIGSGDQVVLSDGAFESQQFQIQCGTMTGSTFTGTTTLTNKIIFNGTKPYYQVPGSTVAQATARIQEDDRAAGCTIVDRLGKMLTEAPRNSIQYTGSLPPSVDAGTDYVAVKLADADNYTISYFNDLERGAPAASALAQGIEAFEIAEYSAAGSLLARTYIPNVQANGGGANTTYREGAAALYPYKSITMGAGYNNLEGMQYTDTSGTAATTFNFNANTAAYWIIPRAYTPALCSQQYLSQAVAEPLYVVRDNTPPCNEYPNLQVSWLNRWGFRDYFKFKLKQELSQKQKSNTYNKTWNNYNDAAAGYTSTDENALMFGGETVFNKSVTTSILANTDYLTDAESYYLNGLFRASNIRMRTDATNIPYFTDWPQYSGANWFPMVINNSKFTEKTYRKNRLFQFEIQANFAHNPQIQKGS